MARILAIDDSAATRRIIVDVLTGAGHEVTEALHGREALEQAKAQKHAFDLVISDLNMPVMDGITFIRFLRLLPAYRGVPVLLLTTERAAEKKQIAREAGAAGWIVKPFKPPDLIATVKKVLG